MNHFTASDGRLPSAVCRLTSGVCQLTSATCELTSARRDVASIVCRMRMNRRRVTLATDEVTSERDDVTALWREAPGDQRAVADERRRVPAMGQDVLVARQSANASRSSAPCHRGDVSDAHANVARERRVVAIARTDGLTRRWMVTARSDDVQVRRRELPPNAYDLPGGACEVPPSEDVARNRLWMITEGNGHAAGGVRDEITESVVSTSLIATDREMGALDRKET